MAVPSCLFVSSIVAAFVSVNAETRGADAIVREMMASQYYPRPRGKLDLVVILVILCAQIIDLSFVMMK